MAGLEPLPDDELGAPASDVHDEPPPSVVRQGVGHAEIDEPGLLVPGDDLDGVAQRPLGRNEELRAPAHGAQRVGAHRPHLAPAQTAQSLPEPPQARQGALAGLGGQPTVLVQPRRELQLLAELIDHLQRPAVADLRDDHVEAVGAQVDGGQGVAGCGVSGIGAGHGPTSCRLTGRRQLPPGRAVYR